MTNPTNTLREALQTLIKGYVSTLENARDRILMLGGQCDSLDDMDCTDIHLRAARAALAATDDAPLPVADGGWKYGDPERRLDNWTRILAKSEPLIGKLFRNHRGEEFMFFGLVAGDDDYYYGMWSSHRKDLHLLSCVGDFDSWEYTLVPPAPSGDREGE